MTPMHRGIFSLDSGSWMECHSGDWKGWQITQNRKVIEDKMLEFLDREEELSLESSLKHGPVRFVAPYEFWE